ncbi:MAG TPA: hypothetical protein ENK03_00330 [Candidatus Cloacimonetes bacterium]|nr:hypothetical protein [Candidatus Cloacimonadota bacterium]
MILRNKNFAIIILVGLLFISCTNLSYKKSAKTLKAGKYIEAIQELDAYIEISKHPAFKEKAKELRSQAYYQLGLNEYKMNNYTEASEYFFLANSDKADSLLDNCYFEIAQVALDDLDYPSASDYLSFIIFHLQESEKMPDVLYDQIIIQTNYSKNIHAAYATYQILQDRFPTSDAFTQAMKIVDTFMPQLIDEAKVQWDIGLYAEALDKLFIYLDYPADFITEIKDMIGNVYYTWAVTLLQDRKLDKVQTYLIHAEEYNSQLADHVNDKLIELASIYITQGDGFLVDREIDRAISSYRKTLDIIEDYQVAYNKIARAEEFARRIAQAAQLVAKGDAQFDNEEYVGAYESYSEAYKIDSIPQIYDKINLAYIWTRITNDPEQYAIEIVKQYNQGIIPDKIDEVETIAQKNYSRQDIRVTPWQVFRTVTQNSYEVRYTIQIPDKNYFLRWLIRLETGEVVPLNDATEELLAS